MKKIYLIVMISLTSHPMTSLAWGKKGHAIVAEIAFTFLSQDTKQAVEKYLGDISIQEAGNWMDEVRGTHKYDYMKSWHYINIEKGNQYTASQEDNIVNALNKAITALEHREKLTDEEIKLNLLVIFHLAGDLHQPLHVGYGMDKGGNDIQVRYLNRPSNLHTVWDREIIESEHITANDCLLLFNHFDKDEIKHFQVVNIENWICQPRSLLGNVYNFQDSTIDQAYADRNKKIVEEQLLIAGIRLSAVLQQVFKA